MIDRRNFLANTALLAALPSLKVLGANDRIRLGVIGSGSRGQYVMEGFLSYPDCAVAAVCDVYKPNAAKAAAIVESQLGATPDVYGDYRRVLERKDIDAVLVATPDHWHCPITIAACEAEKDVYVEKPLSNAIEPCVQAMRAAEKNKRVVQVGVQQRSFPHFQRAAKLVQDGLLGRVYHAPMLYPGGYGQSYEQPSDPPEGLDWDMFQGPAARHPYTSSRQRSWRAYYDYGGGLVTDWGVHLVDVVHWYLADDLPRAVSASSQYVRFQSPDKEKVPDTFALSWTYDKFVSSFTNWSPNWSTPELPADASGNYFVGERGTLFINRSGFMARPVRRGGQQRQEEFEPVVFRKPPEPQRVEEGTRLHVRNFLDCIKSRQKPAADIETGFRSTLPTLLGLLAIRNGRMYSWDGSAAKPA
jgi:predicted dehydrogenase